MFKVLLEQLQNVIVACGYERLLKYSNDKHFNNLIISVEIICD